MVNQGRKLKLTALDLHLGALGLAVRALVQVELAAHLPVALELLHELLVVRVVGRLLHAGHGCVLRGLQLAQRPLALLLRVVQLRVHGE
jgi:hypothetical protein